VYDMAEVVDEDVAIMPVLDLQEVLHQWVPGQALDEVPLGELKVPGVGVPVEPIKACEIGDFLLQCINREGVWNILY
jgi:hypothetical protein